MAFWDLGKLFPPSSLPPFPRRAVDPCRTVRDPTPAVLWDKGENEGEQRLSGLSFLARLLPFMCERERGRRKRTAEERAALLRDVTLRHASYVLDVCRSFSPMSNAPSKWLRLLSSLPPAELDRGCSGDSEADSGSGADSSGSFSRPRLKPARKGNTGRQTRLQAARTNGGLARSFFRANERH